MKKDKRKNNGGARKGAGRKPIEDPKVQLNIRPQKSLIEKLGGKRKCETIALELLQRYAGVE